MKSLARRGVVAASVMLATLVATEAANARSHVSHAPRYVDRRPAAPLGYGYDTQASPHYGFGPLVPIQPDDVVSGDRIIGRDPDPFIRGQILREYDSGRN
jgi:hypothetical protein